MVCKKVGYTLIRAEGSIVITAPPEKVWEMLAADRFHEWDSGMQNKVKSVEFISEVDTPEDKFKVGTSAGFTDKRACVHS
jgi:hypothetical protein